MCGGCPGALPVSDEIRYNVQSVQCSAITVDLLRTYKRPIDCYLQHDLFAQIGSTQEELTNASEYLLKFIHQKQEDPDDCEGIESLAIIRSLVDRIIKKGICL